MIARRSSTIVAAVLTAAFVTAAVYACAVPVFRYALERWDNDVYPLVIFHRGPLTGQDLAVAERLTGPRDAALHVNLDAQLVDVDQKNLSPVLTALHKQASPPRLPWVVLLNPQRADQGDAEPNVIWSGPLDATAAARMVDSPKRQDLAKRLLSGDSVVWVLVESGDKAKDDAAAKLLSETSRKLEQALRIPALEVDANSEDEEMAQTDIPMSTGVPLKVAFSVLRISQDDPAEAFFVQMLRTVTGAHDANVAGPQVFPIFGRGRALTAMSGDGISSDAICMVAEFLTGDCSCQVKEDAPGYDLLMSADWDGGLQGHLASVQPLPPLTGIMPATAPTGSAATAKEIAAGGSAATAPASTGASKPHSQNHILWIALGVLAAGAIVVAAIALRLGRRSGKQ